MLTIHQLKKTFDGTSVLKGVDLTVNKGDVIAIIGQSGGGKTTVGNIVSGIYKPTGGKPPSSSRATTCSGTKPP